jgi:hypothetical protein
MGPLDERGERHEGRATDRNRARLTAGCRSSWRRSLARLNPDTNRFLGGPSGPLFNLQASGVHRDAGGNQSSRTKARIDKHAATCCL